MFRFIESSNSSNFTTRSNHQKCSIKKVYLKKFRKIYRRTSVSESFYQNCRSKAYNFLKNEKMFSCKFPKIFINTFFTEYLQGFYTTIKIKVNPILVGHLFGCSMVEEVGERGKHTPIEYCSSSRPWQKSIGTTIN